MDCSLLLSEGFHQLLHRGSTELPARPGQIPECECRHPRRQCGQFRFTQAILCEGRLELQTIGRHRYQSIRGLWLVKGLRREEDVRAQYFHHQPGRQNRKGIHRGKAANPQRGSAPSSGGIKEELTTARTRWRNCATNGHLCNEVSLIISICESEIGRGRRNFSPKFCRQLVLLSIKARKSGVRLKKTAPANLRNSLLSTKTQIIARMKRESHFGRRRANKSIASLKLSVKPVAEI